VVGKPIEGYGIVRRYGSHNLLEGEGRRGLPLGEQAAVRLSGKVHERDGIWNNWRWQPPYGDEIATPYGEPCFGSRTPRPVVTFNLHSGARQQQAQPQK